MNILDKIKIRPAVLVIALGLVAALNGIVFFADITLPETIAFSGTICTALAAIASKLVESEEKTP